MSVLKAFCLSFPLVPLATFTHAVYCNRYLRAALTDLVTSVCQRPAEYKIEANGVDLSVAKNVDLLGEAFLTVCNQGYIR